MTALGKYHILSHPVKTKSCFPIKTTRLPFPSIIVRKSGIGVQDLKVEKADRVVCKELHVV